MEQILAVDGNSWENYLFYKKYSSNTKKINVSEKKAIKLRKLYQPKTNRPAAILIKIKKKVDKEHINEFLCPVKLLTLRTNTNSLDLGQNHVSFRNWFVNVIFLE